MLDTVDEILSMAVAQQCNQIVLLLSKDPNPSNAELIALYWQGLQESADAIATMKDAGLSSLSQEQLDIMQARLRMIGQQSEGGK